MYISLSNEKLTAVFLVALVRTIVVVVALFRLVHTLGVVGAEKFVQVASGCTCAIFLVLFVSTIVVLVAPLLRWYAQP
jgi:hypothetical protein